jgi:hypothetical protein
MEKSALHASASNVAKFSAKDKPASCRRFHKVKVFHVCEVGGRMEKSRVRPIGMRRSSRKAHRNSTTWASCLQQQPTEVPKTDGTAEPSANVRVRVRTCRGRSRGRFPPLPVLARGDSEGFGSGEKGQTYADGFRCSTSNMSRAASIATPSAPAFVPKVEITNSRPVLS